MERVDWKGRRPSIGVVRAFSDMAPPGLLAVTGLDEAEQLAGSEGQCGIAEQGLKGPRGGQVDANAMGSLADAAPSLKRRARGVSICAERHAGGS